MAAIVEQQELKDLGPSIVAGSGDGPSSEQIREKGWTALGGRAGTVRITDREVSHSESDPGPGARKGPVRTASDDQGRRTKSATNKSASLERPHINLCQAVKDNKKEDVKRWLEYNKKRVRFQDKHGYTPVHYAAKFNHLDILKTLHKEGNADITVKTVSEEYTPLHLAARHTSRTQTTDDSAGASDTKDQLDCTVEADGGLCRQDSSEETIRYLKDCKGVDVNAKDSYDITPLHLACQAGNLEGVKVLLEDDNVDVNAQDSNGDTPLHEACLHGKDKIVEMLLNKMKESAPKGKTGSEINLLIKNHLGLTPFHLACREGHLQIAKQLLDISDQPFQLVVEKDMEGATALHLACQKDQPEVIHFLLTNAASALEKKNDGMTPIHVAAQHGCLEVMKLHLLSEVNADIDIKDMYKQTPLHYATEYGKVEMMQLLLNNGANKEAKDLDGYTPLLTAAEFGQKEAFECLMERDAEITAQNKDEKSALFLAAESNHPEIVEIILGNDEGKKLLSVADTNSNTPLHAAAKKGHIEPVEKILECSDEFALDAKNLCRKTAMHLAAENGHTDVVKILIERCREYDMMKCVDEDGNTPLHLTCTRGYEEVALCLMKNNADIGARNEVLWTPLDCAASKGHARVIERLVNFKADIDPKDKQKTTPLHLAAKEGHVTAVETLIKHGALVSGRDYRGFNALDWAIENGHSNVAEAIINSRKWKFALRNHITMQDGRETTPLRKLIQRMPEVAELVLKKCTVSNAKDRNVQSDSKDYTVTFNYEFIEDKDHAKVWKDDIESNTLKDCEERTEESMWQKLKQKWLHIWGRSKLDHPLRIMVKSQCTELLKHPLMYNLIEHKWSKFGRTIFSLMLLFHILLVIFLTAFALRLLNPFSPTCMAVSSNLFNLTQPGKQVPVKISQLEAPNDAVVMEYLTNQNVTITNNTAYVDGQSLCFSNVSTAVKNAIDGVTPIEPVCGECGLNVHDINFIKVAAGIVIACSVIRLLLEFLRCIRQLHLFFADFCTWVEVPLFIFAIIFAAVFDRECLCPRAWQWQVGIAAVFLVWVDLILYMRRMRILDTGIYVLMFEAIFKTFLKVIILTVLLVVTFALTFYMTFNQFVPRFARSPFASPFTSIWKTMTMTTGELGYDDIFRQFTSESAPNAPDVPFPAISYILWVLFLILMPILFTNLLVGLAVDDIKDILDAAALTRLALRVDLVLSIEEYFWFLPRVRNHMNEKQLKIKPYKGHVKRFLSPIRKLLRGENYCSAEHIANVLNPVKSASEQQTQALMHEMAKMQEALQVLSRMVHESIQQNRSGGAQTSAREGHGGFVET